MASLLFAWVAYDANKLCKRMQPDDYMKGVVYFYTDFLFMCCCCIVLGCLGNLGAWFGSNHKKYLKKTIKIIFTSNYPHPQNLY